MSTIPAKDGTSNYCKDWGKVPVITSSQGWPVFLHSTRTAAASVASLLTARLFRLPETYWAGLTTLVVTQSSLSMALADSQQRFFGTFLGAIVGAIVANYFGPDVLAFGGSVFALGVLCSIAHASRSAYKFGAITLAIVLLIPWTGPAWRLAFHRFAEVSIGIGVALVMALIWPEKESKPAGNS